MYPGVGFSSCFTTHLSGHVKKCSAASNNSEPVNVLVGFNSPVVGQGGRPVQNWSKPFASPLQALQKLKNITWNRSPTGQSVTYSSNNFYEGKRGQKRVWARRLMLFVEVKGSVNPPCRPSECLTVSPCNRPAVCPTVCKS